MAASCYSNQVSTRKNPLCFAKSMASVLYYIGLKGESGDINDIAFHFSNKPLNEACKKFKSLWETKYQLLVNVSFIIITNRKKIQETIERRWKITIEELVENKTIYPTLVVPIENDGSTGHAICVVDDLIFDSTQENALKLYRESLDWICGRKGYKELYVAIRFYKSSKKGAGKFIREMKNHETL